MFERLIRRGTALAESMARRRRERLAEALREEPPAGVRVEQAGEAVTLSGRGLGRRYATEPALRWLVVRSAQDDEGRGG